MRIRAPEVPHPVHESTYGEEIQGSSAERARVVATSQKPESHQICSHAFAQYLRTLVDRSESSIIWNALLLPDADRLCERDKSLPRWVKVELSQMQERIKHRESDLSQSQKPRSCRLLLPCGRPQSLRGSHYSDPSSLPIYPPSLQLSGDALTPLFRRSISRHPFPGT